MTTLGAKIQTRRDTAANWTSKNPVLLAGELGIETDTRLFKAGDGSTAWKNLGYLNAPAYGSCSTAAATAAKTVAVTGFKLYTGAEVDVKFTVTNTAANPTLNVNSTGAKAIYYRGAAISAGYLAANRTYKFVYNGTQYELVGDLNTDTNNATAQNISTANNTYPILLGNTANATANIGNKAALFGSGIKANPSTSEIIATKFTGNVVGNVTGNVTGDVSGNAGTVNGHTVAKDVPSNAVFTDTNNKVAVTELSTDSDTHSEKNVLIKTGTLNANGTEGAVWNRGLRIHERKGTTSRQGNLYLALGTSIAAGTDNNMKGILRLFSAKANYADISQADITSNVNHVFPATGGTVLNTGTTALSNAASSGKKVADLKLNGTTTTLYAPPPDSMGAASASAAGTAGLVPAPAKGDQDKVLSGAGTWVTNTGDTHWTTHLYAGASNGNANAATTNGNTYLIVCDNTTARDRRKIAGSGATTVTSDANGNITINSTDHTYSNFVKSGSSAAAGLVPKPDTTAGTTKYLREDGTWQVPPNTGDTHWTTHLYAGASNGNANAATTNGNTYLIVCDNTTARDRRKIVGSGATTVTSDANGNITINSTDHTYSPAAGNSATWGVAKGTNPGSNQYHEHISYDNSGNGTGTAYRFALHGRSLNTAGQTSAYMIAYDATAGATAGAQLGVYYPKGGTSFVQSTAAQNLFNNLIRANGNFQRKDTGITQGTAPSSNRYVYWQHLDNNNTVMSEIRMGYLTDKRHHMSFRVKNDSNTWFDALQIQVAAAGTAAEVFVPTPATSDRSTRAATTAYVQSNLDTIDCGKITDI